MPRLILLPLVILAAFCCSSGALATPDARAGEASSTRAEAYALYLEAEEMAAGARFSDARRLLEQVLELDPTANVVRARLARVCLDAGDVLCAGNEARRAVTIDGNEVEAHKVLAELALQRYRGGGDGAALERGLGHLERATEIAPRDSWAWAVWVRVLGFEGRLDEAEDVAARAAATPGLDPAAPWMALARVLLARGRQDEAIALLERAGLGGQAAVPLLELLAELMTSNRDFAGVERALARLRVLKPDDADVARRLGKVRSDLGDYPGALEPLQVAFELRAGDPLVRRDLAAVLVRLGRGAEALEILDALAEVYRTPHTYLTWARAAEQAGRSRLAAQQLVKLLDRLGSDERASFAPALRRRAARNYLQAGDAASALSMLDRLGEDAASWRIRLSAQRALGAAEPALASLHQRIDATADGARLAAVYLEHIAVLRSSNEALAAAREIFASGESRAMRAAITALELTGWGQASLGAAILDMVATTDAQETGWLRARAGVLYAAGRHDEAETIYREILAREPQDHSAMNDLGYLLAVSGQRLEEALDLCRQAVALRPEEPAYLDSLGWVLHLSGRSEQALEYLRRAAVRADERSIAEIHEHLGDVYAALSQRKRAIAHWRAARAFAGGAGESRLGEKIRQFESLEENPR